KQAEEALRESEARFRGTFENAAVGIVHVDEAGRFLRMNETFCGIVGYNREELMQKTFQEITHPEDLGSCTEAFVAMMSGTSPGFALEKRYLRKGGAVVWAEIFAAIQRDAEGRPSYGIGML